MEYNIEKFGEKFKEIRQNKHLSQKEVCGKEISRTTLSKFENGGRSMNIHHFLRLLERIDMSFDEFSYICSDYTLKPKKQIVADFLSLYSNYDIQSITKLIKDSENYLAISDNWYVKAILEVSHAYLQDQKDTPDLINATATKIIPMVWEELSKQDEWYLLDLRLLNAILYSFPIETTGQIAKEVKKRIGKYQNFTQVLPLITALYLNLSLLYLQNNKSEKAENILSEAKNLAYQLKRTDFLAVALVRHGIATKNKQEMEQGVLLSTFLQDKNLQKELQEEVENLSIA
ncbi:MAG: helix-turn-helix transcriptional regulator [Lactobacillales bacterium]|jgi:transcriptional regulator with XRE-family HTH domain|nr:helix-turn-helix transcriptional regulator [Lactobacillales bacterium]